MLLLREFDGMQEKTPLWLALTRAMSSELTVVSAAAGGGRLSENTMRTLEDGGRVSPDAADGVAEDDGATSTSCNYRTVAGGRYLQISPVGNDMVRQTPPRPAV